MKIYLDYIFFENIILNYIILYQVNIFTKSNIKKRCLIGADLILSIYTVISYVYKDSFIDSIFIRLLLVFITIYICFFPKQIKEYIKKVIYFYIISFMYVGIMISLSLLFGIKLDNILNKVLLYIICGMISYIFNKYMWKMWKTNIKKEDLTYTINIKGQEIPSFIDTGNLVKSKIYNLDVIFLDNKWYGVLELKGLLNKKIDIGVNTVAKKCYIYGYIIEGVKIYKDGKFINNLDKIIFSFSSGSINIEDKYSALIGYNTYIEKLKGVIL
ncbi:MAG: sigma-E processing peptidase SpoIIGA [Clostridia bacterium]